MLNLIVHAIVFHQNQIDQKQQRKQHEGTSQSNTQQKAHISTKNSKRNLEFFKNGVSQGIAHENLPVQRYNGFREKSKTDKPSRFQKSLIYPKHSLKTRKLQKIVRNKKEKLHFILKPELPKSSF